MELMKHGPLEIDDWKNRWSVGRFDWHKPYYNPALMKCYENSLKKCPVVFVPLCGKSLDLKCLYDKGHTVIGVEVMESAVKDFFKENCIPFKKRTKNGVNIYETQDGRLNIVATDFFDLKLDELEMALQFDGVWDRGSFVAINACDRERYINQLCSWLSPTGTILLTSLEYDPTEYNGPPYNCTLEDIASFFGKKFETKLLLEENIIETHQFAKKAWGLKSYLIERTHVMTRK